MGTAHPALTAWGVTGSLRYSLELPEETPSNNIIKGMHFKDYMHMRRRFRLFVLKSLKSKRPALPIEQSFIVVRRYSAGQLDWDNALGGLKPVFDCLVVRTEKNPDGLGLIRDDSPRSMPYPPFMEQLKAKPKDGHTNILIFEVSSEPLAIQTPQAAA
jgi:hypothetical protein